VKEVQTQLEEPDISEAVGLPLERLDLVVGSLDLRARDAVVEVGQQPLPAGE
jgi:hypothetical protein